jgi:hypothetical protein
MLDRQLHPSYTQVQALMFVTPPWILPSKIRLQRMLRGASAQPPAKAV